VITAKGGALRLVAATDAHFLTLASGAAPQGFSLPEGGIDTPEVIHMLGDLARSVRRDIDPAAWLIIDEGEVVGLCSITKVFAHPGVVEIGYGIASSRRGRGFATAAVAVLLDIIKADSRVRTVAAETAVANSASQRVLEKNGFIRTGERTDAEDGPLSCWQAAVG